MARILLSFFAAALAACTPSPQESAMHNLSPDPGAAAQGSIEVKAKGAAEPDRAAQGPIPEPLSVAANPVPARPADTPAEAQGRRSLSTAFVMVGPDGHLIVELRSGRVLVLRNVVLRPEDFCGLLVPGGGAGARYCGGYAEVAAARPGGAPAREGSDPTVPNPVESPRNPPRDP